MGSLTRALFQSKSRDAVLSALCLDRTVGSVSALARQAGLTPRAVAREVANLEEQGLVVREAHGAEDRVRANPEHPAFLPLVRLLDADRHLKPDRLSARAATTLAAHGAPLLVSRRRRSMPLESALLDGLVAARRDATLLRSLPVVIANAADRVDWPLLLAEAHRRRLRPELGMLVDLTAHLLGRPDLSERARPLRDRRRKRLRYFLEPGSSYEHELASRRTPEVVRRWGFLMNLGEDAFRSTLEKHVRHVHPR